MSSYSKQPIAFWGGVTQHFFVKGLYVWFERQLRHCKFAHSVQPFPYNVVSPQSVDLGWVIHFPYSTIKPGLQVEQLD